MSLPYIDIISPIEEIFARLQHGRMHRFYYYRTSAYNGYRVEKLLRRYGIRVWGRQINGDRQSFVVKQKQAVWAEYVLCRAGVPLACELLDQRNAEYPDQHPVDSMPIPWTERGIPAISFIDHFGEWLAKVIR